MNSAHVTNADLIKRMYFIDPITDVELLLRREGNGDFSVECTDRVAPCDEGRPDDVEATARAELMSSCLRAQRMVFGMRDFAAAADFMRSHFSICFLTV